ncbi:hypothetical protein [Nocardioides sp.]|uniref:hypothetical protein n=1 Tax=Nocardioides sp. TaxID=35761 RepID=UPI0031FE852D
MTHPAIEHRPATARPGSLGWWARDRSGRLTIAMWPNPAICVWLVAKVLEWTGLVSAVSGSTLRDIGRGALIVWAVDELVRGASPLRRILGAVLLAWLLFALLR